MRQLEDGLALGGRGDGGGWGMLVGYHHGRVDRAARLLSATCRRRFIPEVIEEVFFNHRVLPVKSGTVCFSQVGFVTFFLNSVLDNLTSTIVMVSLLRKLVPPSEYRKTQILRDMKLGALERKEEKT
ncbi:uncharacterized protein A4U43_C07F31260 [Asparagus officinalis]|uniref:Uncharacterized protein n=1 Tax=Asparagus officinalis TaxID=4686 RepID=A0A5P1ELH9_ASPOF|nr:uncharacterized protein A4U43_C07F31260 [Asparagus officinalis]